MTPYRIIIAEDDPAVRDTLIQIVQRLPVPVLISAHADGAAALADYAQHGAALVLTDHAMPIMDGLTLTQQLRVREPRLPIVLISGSPAIEAAARAAGASQVLVKPVGAAVLVATLMSLLTTP